MSQFKNFIPPKAKVIRNGTEQQIDAVELVPGDIVKVGNGDNIPADLRIFQCQEMKVNNASLTGESEDLLRKDKPEKDEVVALEAKNLAFFGTACTAGSGVGIVVNIGDKTVIGQIANLAQTATSGETPLSIEIHRFIKIISSVAIFLGVSFFIFGTIYQYEFITNLVFAIGIIVANVPEGLLATVTVSLALTAKRMATKKVLVKNLESVETLGSTSCICSDKTGTLTQNVMTVSHSFYDNQEHDFSINYQEQTQDEPVQYDITDPAFRELYRAVTLGTTASFAYNPSDGEIKKQIGTKLGKAAKKVTDDDMAKYKDEAVSVLREKENGQIYKKRQTVGDASESGLVKFIAALEDGNSEFKMMDYRAKYPIHQYEKYDSEKQESTKVVCELPFNSFNKFNCMIRNMANNDEADKRHLMVCLKGVHSFPTRRLPIS